MVYRRNARPSFYFEAKLRQGFKSMCTHTSDKKMAQRMEHMWSELADRYRAWDLLEPVAANSRLLGALYDVWTETRHDVEEMRRRAKDVDVVPFVADWHAVFSTQVSADWAAHALAHVRHFFPDDSARLASAITEEWLSNTLAAYPGKRNTRRKVHSSLCVFFDYLTSTKRLWTASPMLAVDRPANELTPPVFYDSAAVARIIKWQETPERQAFFALVYGTGADVSPALLVERSDINPATHEVRIVGTKTAFRDRIVRLSDSAWPTFWGYAKGIMAGRVFPSTWNRWTVSDWHRQTVGDGVKDTHGKVERAGLKLSKRLPLRKVRHHFAVRLLEAGAPVRVVAEQLGSDDRTVLKHYGPWTTSPEDRAKWEKIASTHETERREAK